MARSKRVRARRTQVALGASPKAGERCTVSITVDQQTKCALGTLVKVRGNAYNYGSWTLGATRQLRLRGPRPRHTQGSCDQFSVGAGLFFSDGPKVVLSHNGTSAVYVTGTQQLTADEDDGARPLPSLCRRPPGPRVPTLGSCAVRRGHRERSVQRLTSYSTAPFSPRPARRLWQ